MFRGAIQTYKKHRLALAMALFLVVATLFPVDVSHAFLSSIGKAIEEFFFNICVAIGGFFLLIGSVMLDTAVYHLVVDMGSFFRNNHGMGIAVSTGWVLIRDLINMLFIFALIYIGIKTILDAESSGTRKQLGMLLAAALLINFSLFFTQMMVDFSNLIAAQVYNQIVAGQTIATGANPSEAATAPIAAAYLDAIGVTSWFSKEGISPDQVAGGNLFIFSLLLLVFFVLAGLAFLIGSIYVVTRFVALLLYMVFSPVMFLGWILPRFQSITDDWWKGFFRYTMFAPVYLFIIYLSIFILRGIVGGVTTNQATFAGGMSSPTVQVSFTLLVLHFVIMIGLLWGSLKIGDKLSIAGSKMAMGMANTARGSLQGIAYRNTLGRGFDRLRKGYDYLDNVAEDENRTGRARLAARTLRTIGAGESGRKAVVKARDYGAGGVGFSAAEDLDSARTKRAAGANVVSNLTKDGDLSKLSGSQLVDLMNKNPALVTQNAARLKPSQIKAIREEKEKLNDAQKQKFEGDLAAARKTKLENGSDAEKQKAAAELLKSYKGDPSELGIKTLIDNEHVLREIVSDGKILDKLGEDLSTQDKRDLRAAVMNEANKQGKVTKLSSYFNNSRNWTLS